MHALKAAAGIVLGLNVLAFAACKNKVSQPECDALIDHFAEVVVRERFPDAGADTVNAERTRERSEAKGDVLRNCTSEVQPSEHACAMKAQGSEAIIKCLE
ncbi:MAG: hypothetical protein JWP97_6790 [Labilithrix sp.]|nr:hypothetical protein [Labilithrix sp.]